jgi:surfactin synthase thioesterase subunit
MHWNILSSQQLKDKVLIRMFLAILREDMKIVENYTLQRRAYHRLPCPISILVGAKDTVAQAWKMPAWADFTTRSCSFHTFPGGHGFITERQDKVIDLINTTLSSVHKW